MADVSDLVRDWIAELAFLDEYRRPRTPFEAS